MDDYFILHKTLVGSLHEGLGENMRSWAHVVFTMMRQLEYIILLIYTLVLHLYCYHDLMYQGIEIRTHLSQVSDLFIHDHNGSHLDYIGVIDPI